MVRVMPLISVFCGGLECLKYRRCGLGLDMRSQYPDCGPCARTGVGLGVDVALLILAIGDVDAGLYTVVFR